MASKQHSKFRHLKLTPNKSDRCMQNIICSSGGHSDSTICDVGRSFIAIILEGQSGGSFLVIRLDEYGRIPIDHCKVSGHSKKVLDVKWSPFNDNIVASCSEDSTVKSWYIPENGLTGSHLEDCLVQCNASGKKITSISWHPTAKDIIGGICNDCNVYIWRIDQGDCLFIAQHPAVIHSFAWNFDGTLFATTCKDQLIRCWDVYERQVLWKTKGHQSNKQSKLCFCGSTNYIFSTGFNVSQREVTLWITKVDFVTMSLDSASSVLYPFYDEDTMVLSVIGKGDTTIRYYQVFKTKPQLMFLTLSQVPEPIKGFGFLPKSEINFMDCEIARLYLLQASILQPISISVTRLTSVFQVCSLYT
eukprot:TRINITY_DN1945_c0_g2_i2.p1 TRINITY_DN1945_c0_g2~~TRINITY_DN1945_c0_g2_i2.p1  ORF type:complete len:373 (+),score=-14.85 TRINITY_DN1945_c0_g2_i2:42-1121(+)